MQRKNFINIILFTLPLLILLLFIEIQVRKIPNDYSFKHQQVLKLGDSINTLILGSSHAFRDVNPEYLDEFSFNLSNLSQSLYYDLQILKNYIHELPNMEYLILEMSYPSLTHKLNTGEEEWRKYYYYRYMNIRGLVNFFDLKAYSEIAQMTFFETFAKLYRYWNGKSYITCTERGWGKRVDKFDSFDLDEDGRNTAKRHENFNSDISLGLDILNQIIDICNEYNIKLYIITFPVWESYREAVNPDKFNITVKVANEMDNKFDNVTYLSFWNHDAFSREDFYDADHLNNKGSKKLTQMLNELMYHDKYVAKK